MYAVSGKAMYCLTASGMIFGLHKSKGVCSVMSSGPKINPFLASIPGVSNENYLVSKHSVCEILFMYVLC